MGDLLKVKVLVENFTFKDTDPSFTMYKRVRCTAEDGSTMYFKELIVPRFLQAAVKNKKLNTLYLADISGGKAHCLIAYENDAVSKFDPDEIQDIAKAFKRTGKFFWFGGALASFLSSFAYGIGIILFPIAMYLGWANYVRIPRALDEKKIIEELKSAGFRFARPAEASGAAA